MSIESHPKKIENVTGLDPRDRYLYFIRKVADFGTLYVFAEIHDNGKTNILLWPELEFSRLWFKAKKIEQTSLQTILLKDFLENFFNKYERKPVHIYVFPVDADAGYECSGSKLEKDLREEASQYE